MINFLLDFDIWNLWPILIFLFGIVGALIRSQYTIVGMLLVTILCPFFIIGVKIASAPEFKENENILKKLISRYDFEMSDSDTDRIGFHLCSISDYKSQTCKNYIEYFINKELALKKENEEIWKRIEQRKVDEEQRKVDEKNKLEKNIEQVLSEAESR